MSEPNRIEDHSADRRYFVVIPQVVWAKSRDVYDLSLWYTVKMIAGDDGECFVNTEDLAALAMMSTGKVSQCRQHLLDVGLLHGEIRKDPGYRQKVWHLTIPDLWQQNVAWRQSLGDSLKARLRWKANGNSSLHLMKPSPDEAKPSPHETKDNQQGDPTVGDGLTTTQQQSVTLLVSFGVTHTVAEWLAKRTDLERVRGWITYAESANGLTSPAAFVVAKLKSGERPPEHSSDDDDRREYLKWLGGDAYETE
jgi:hypothetical protein